MLCCCSAHCCMREEDRCQVATATEHQLQSPTPFRGYKLSCTPSLVPSSKDFNARYKIAANPISLWCVTINTFQELHVFCCKILYEIQCTCFIFCKCVYLHGAHLGTVWMLPLIELLLPSENPPANLHLGGGISITHSGNPKIMQVPCRLQDNSNIARVTSVLSQVCWIAVQKTQFFFFGIALFEILTSEIMLCLVRVWFWILYSGTHFACLKNSPFL